MASVLNGVLTGVLYDSSGNKTTSPISLERQIAAYANITQGLLEDNGGVFSNLQTLNDLVKCANQTLALAQTACLNTSAASCIGIKETSVFTPPFCTSSAQVASAIFENLKRYIQSEGDLLGRFSQDLGGP